ncbi:MAG: efflux RND transporter periplasmic adaptor subunit [Marinilabiliaceae bacterium]|nr:efflux RND transporter periplasmic adaptor subunit [Marinilabiliaceae bacterium]
MKYTFIQLSVIASLVSCGGEVKNSDEEKLQNMLVEDKPTVSVSVVHEAPFNTEIVSNGKATASRYADVYWDVDGNISSISAVNGKYISEGATIAQIESFRPYNNLESAKADMERTRLSMHETIIGQGYDPETDSIPDNVTRLAEVKSGFMQSKASYLSAQYEYEHCTLKAPISGMVANLTDKVSNKANRSRAFCRIIDMASMTAEFSVIENELPLISVGEKVEVTAFAIPDKRWEGTITEINPFIESNGMVRVKARIASPEGLYEGTNISVCIRKDVGVHMAVPKSAIVMRSNKPVVFKAKNGLAQWCYVDRSIENSDMVAITSPDIQDGDTIVVTGNTFLAHNSEINY